MSERESTHEVAERTEKGLHVERTTVRQDTDGVTKETTEVEEEGEAKQVKPDGR